MVVFPPENHAGRHTCAPPGAPQGSVIFNAGDSLLRAKSSGLECSIDALLSGPFSVKAEIGEDGDDDSAIRGSDLSTRSDGSLETSRASTGSLKPALRRASSAERSALRVTWAPDVYDPPASAASHSKVKPKLYKPPASVQYHSRRYKGKHGGHGKGGKKQVKCDKNEGASKKDYGQASRSGAGSVPLSDSKASAEALDLKKDDNLVSSVIMPAANAADGWSQAPEGVGDTAQIAGGVGETCGGTVLLELPSAASSEAASPGRGSTASPTGSARSQQSKQGKNRTKKSSSKSSPPRKMETSGIAENGGLLADVTNKRLYGATEFAAVDMDAARELLLGDLNGGHMFKSEAEQARCLRMLADTQSGDQREKSLALAVNAFGTTNLALEHAEALFCLAQNMVQRLLEEIANSSEQMTEGESCSTVVLISAKEHLKEAAGLLMKCPTLGNVLARKGLETPTGRRRKARLSQSHAAELSAATSVMGSICELQAKVCLLLKEIEEAGMQPAAAAAAAAAASDDMARSMP